MIKKKHPNIKSMNLDTQLMCDGWPRGHCGAREDLNTCILFNLTSVPQWILVAMGRMNEIRATNSIY